MEKLKKISRFASLAFVITFILSGCGGGGGGSSVPSECRSYCRLACAKIGICRGFTDADVETCRNSCVDAFREDGGGTAQTCQNASQNVANASCAQLERLLGFRSFSDAGDVETKSDETVGMSTADCGATLGWLQIEGAWDDE